MGDGAKFNKILISHPVLLLEAMFTFLAFYFGNLTFAVIPLSVVFMLNMFFCRDLTPSFAPFAMLSLSTLYNVLLAETFLPFLWILVPVLVSVIFHFVLYPPKVKRGKMYFSTIGVTIALFMGGAGVISAEEYGAPMNLFFLFTLGPLMFLLYFLFLNGTVSDVNHDPKRALARSMTYIGIAAAAISFFMLLDVILPAFKDGTGYWFPGKNDVSTYLMLAAPFPFYYAVKSKNIFAGVGAFLLGSAFCAACVLTLSRGGIIFGAAAFVFCALYAVIASKDTKKRVLFAFLSLAVIAGGLAVFFTQDFVKVTVDENEARVDLYRHAWELFKNYPGLGRGLGYMGSESGGFYTPPTAAMYWFHDTPLQIVASMGILGVFAYGYQYLNRTVTMLKKPSAFKWAVFIAYVTFELMSLVNPGDFQPIPYGIMILFMLTVGEISGKSPKEKA